MSTRQELPTAPAANGEHNEEGDSSAQQEQSQDVWAELFGIVRGLAETVSLALQAFTPTDDKAVSAITKKRLTLRSLQGLKQGQSNIQALLEHLQALQAASKTWQRSMMFASKSHQELMEQIESTTAELHATNERLRSVEAQRLSAVRDAESLRARWSQQEVLVKEVQSALKQREDELENLQFSMHEMQAGATAAQQRAQQLSETAERAEERAEAATAALNDARAEAAKAQSLAERHQQVVAKLTADNLMFLMQLKKAEADLATANQERTTLRLAAEKQRGPWFDQVRAGVEERVRTAMQRSQELEVQMERREADHAEQVQAMDAQRQQLEGQLEAVHGEVADLKRRLDTALDAKQRADETAAAAEASSRELRQRLDDLAAENRVLAESVKAMRQECTERWVNEQSALGKVGGLEERVQELERLVAVQASQAAALQRQLDVQTGVNRQLMAKKEEVEWQLMAAMAKLDGGVSEGPVPLNLHVSGLLQVGGPNQAGRPGEAQQGPTGASEQDPVPPAVKTAIHIPSSGLGTAAGAAAWTASLLPGPAGSSASGPPESADQPHLGNLVAAVALPQSRPDPIRSIAAPYPTLLSQPGSSPQHSTAVGDQLTREPTLALPLGRDGPLHPLLGHAAEHGQGPSSDSRDAAGELELLPQPQRRILQQGYTAAPGAYRGSVRAGYDTASEVPFRLTSLEGGSTVVSSPPSSVALSTEPGSPREGSQVPSATGRGGEAPYGPAALSIRTFSAGGRGAGQPVGPGYSRAGRSGTPAGLWDGALSAGLGWREGGDGGEAAVSIHLAAASGSDAAVVGRRGSLHDGGDVWLVDAASSTSSDDSDLLFAGGVMVVRGVQEDRAAREPAPLPHQAILHDLQQQLQAHLQRPAVPVQAGAEAGVAAGVGPAAGAGAGRAQQQQQQQQQDAAAVTAVQDRMRASEEAGKQQGSKEEDDAFTSTSLVSRVSTDNAIRVRAGPSAASVARSSPQPVSNVHRASMQPRSPSGAGQLPSASHTAPSAASTSIDGAMFGRHDAAVGNVFSITKSSVPRAGGPGGSPLHPAFGPPARRDAASPLASRQAGTPASPSSAAATSSESPALQTSATTLAPRHGHRAEDGAAAAVGTHASARTLAGAVEGAAAACGHGSDALLHGLQVPSRVQAGPPYYATGEPLAGNVVAAFERWTSGGGGSGGGAQELRPAAAAAAPQPPSQHQHARAEPLQDAPSSRQGYGAAQAVPASPLASSLLRSPLRSPRSPPHPACIIIGADGTDPRTSGSGFSGQASLRSSVDSHAFALPPQPAGPACAATATTAPTATSTSQAVRSSAEYGRSPDAGGAASSRPRVSFHGLTTGDGPLSSAVPDGGVGSTGALASSLGSFSSSGGSSLHGASSFNGGGGGTGANGGSGANGGNAGAAPHKTSSVKSVRFSDHGPDDMTAVRQQRGDGDSRPLSAQSGGLRSSGSSNHDVRNRLWNLRPSRSGDGDGSPSHSSRSSPRGASGHDTTPYRSLGPVPHPAIVAVSAANGAAIPDLYTATTAAQPRRLSATDVVVTAVPRGPHTRQ